MGRDGRTRHCDCLLCGHPGKLIEDHEWKEHMRQLHMMKREHVESESLQDASSRMIFGLTVNDQLGREQLKDSPLWGSAQQYDVPSDMPFKDGFDIDPEGLTAVLSYLSPVPSKSRDFLIAIREKTSSIQRKMDRALSHISHHRNIKKLEGSERTVASLKARFERETKNLEIHRSIDELEALLSSVTLETNSVHGKTPPVKALRCKINASIDELTKLIRNWRMENDAVIPSLPATYDMGASTHYSELLYS